jgi:uncharacterized Zn-finger protein
MTASNVGKASVCPIIFKYMKEFTHRRRFYTCKLCGQAVTYSSNIRRHERAHTREKPYVCQQCGKGFSNSSVLGRHLDSHTEKKPCVYM